MLTPLDNATLQEVISRHTGEGGLVFTESREYPIRRLNGVPARWLPQARAQTPAFGGTARPGEFYVFQIGVYALQDIGPLRMSFSKLKGQSGAIPAAAFRCLSLGGTNYHGQPFLKDVSVKKGRLQALWIGVDVPQTARGTYSGSTCVSFGNGKQRAVTLSLEVAGTAVTDHGDSAARSLSRLRWLDSTVGHEATLPKGFTPVQAKGRTLKVLGRELELGEGGLPARIISHFSPANTQMESAGCDVLERPMAFVVETSGGPAKQRSRFGSLRHSDLEANWAARSTGDGWRLETRGRMDYTGSGEVRLHLTADRDLDLNDARLEVPFREHAARYFMGLNKQGGLRPAEVRWKWDTSKHQDCFWMGEVNAGLMLRFKDAEYLRPPVNIYYSFRPLRLPVSWGNEGRGGINLDPASKQAVLVRAFSGPRRLKAGQALDFIFEFYLTPFRRLDLEKQWAVRFQHPNASKDPGPLDEAVAQSDPKHGPNVINVHQATYYSPYINYPYSDDSFPAFCDLVRRAHARGTKVRVYYTTREITQNMPELFPVHSLNGEIILAGPGKEARTLLHPNGPHSWLVENLREDFIPAWEDKVGGKYAELDISVITTPDSRWNNFYLEGLKWLVEKADFDGMYVDDTALDAGSLQRARRILDSRPGRYIDLHTWNHFNGYAGFANNLTIYMELLPYLDRLWLGEGFNASEVPPDFWLVEMSGLPFGLMSEMLDGANPWRGMVFGETARLGWSGDPRGMWKVWDDYGIQGTQFLPFFLKDCPVRTDNADILATVYRKPGRCFIALGSWASTETLVHLQIDWKALRLDPVRSVLFAPAIEGMQSPKQWRPGDAIPVSPKRGWFLVLDESS